jgi:hypothetical protein
MSYWLSPQVEQKMLDEKLSLADVEEIVAKSAIIKHVAGNRRYFDWLLRIKDNKVLSLRRIGSAVDEMTDYASGLAYQIEECEDCDGDGCKYCGWIGQVKRLKI